MPEESNQSKFENYSLEFNGTDDEIDCGNSDAINITGPIIVPTISASVSYVVNFQLGYPRSRRWYCFHIFLSPLIV